MKSINKKPIIKIPALFSRIRRGKADLAMDTMNSKFKQFARSDTT